MSPTTRVVIALLLGAVPGAAAATSEPSFDGVLRSDADGRYDALLPPPFKTNHASMVEHDGGSSFMMAWFSGKSENTDNVAIVVSRLTLNATGGFQDAVWGDAPVVSQRADYSNQNAVLFHDDETGVMHCFHSQQGGGDGESEATVWYLNRSDDKPTGSGTSTGPYGWTEPVEIFSKKGSFPKNRLLKNLDGDWLFPMYYTYETPNYSHIKTLSKGEDPASASWGNIDFKDTDNLVQPSVVRLVPGEPALAAFFRDRKKTNVYRATSADDGVTWSEPKALPVENPNSGIEAFTLDSGRVALVYNPCTSCRDPLVLSLSDDGGLTFPHTRVLEQDDGEQEFSYPTMRQDDGNIHVSYTYKREAIKHSIVTEAWVMDPDHQYNATAVVKA